MSRTPLGSRMPVTVTAIWFVPVTSGGIAGGAGAGCGGGGAGGISTANHCVHALRACGKLAPRTEAIRLM